MKKTLLLGTVAAAILAGQFALSSVASAAPDAHTGDRAKMHQSMCEDFIARENGRLSYLETKLNITDAEKAAWKDYKSAAQSNAKENESKCLAHASMKQDGQRPSILDRQAMEVEFLQARIDGIKETTPSLQKLYAVLSDSQKQTLDQAGWRGKGFFGKGAYGHGQHMHHHSQGGAASGGDDGQSAPQEN